MRFACYSTLIERCRKRINLKETTQKRLQQNGDTAQLEK
jgi:hypothetical protein